MILIDSEMPTSTLIWHQNYLRLTPHASQEAAAVAAAHETLIALYPTFQTMLDQQYEQSLARIPDGADKITSPQAMPQSSYRLLYQLGFHSCQHQRDVGK
jgi:hypothetical protein